jgi:predicted MPP superfamily phosphohydrolase
MVTPIILVHLSDIHFWRWRQDGSTYDVDQDIRNELLFDVAAQCVRLGRPTGVVLTGDIAYAADPREYLAAETWLAALSRKLGCPEEAVWMVPGNHDVSRKAIDDGFAVRLLQQALREDPASLARLLTDGTSADALFAPLASYNAFAAKFKCHFDPKQLVWHHDLTLNDGSKLRLCGLNSTLTSSKLDDGTNKKLVLCDIAHRLLREDGVTYVTLCHHPPDWLIDTAQAEDLLVNRAHVQLFGHKHRQRVLTIGKMLRITAGAMQPERSEQDWVPRYNLLSVVVNGSGSARKLAVKVTARMWSDARKCFVADTADCGADDCGHELDLAPWTGPSAAAFPTTPAVPLSPADLAKHPDPPPMDPARRLTYRFLTLSHPKRLTVALALGLVRDDDDGLADRDLFLRYFERARDESRLAALWSEVEKQHDPTVVSPNPFVGR